MADKNVNTDHMTEKQKVREITDKLQEGLKELFESEKYKSYLSTMSKFHNYSFNNIQLIAMQKPDATLVCGYKAWQKNFDRHVKKGERAIRILAPAPYKIREERDKLDPVTGEMMFDENGMPRKEEVEVTIPAFRVVSVFDVSSTEGKPLPELGAQELLSTVEGYEDFVRAVMNVSPVPIGFEDIPGDSRGYFSISEKRIAVQENMGESQTLKTMVHEVAHAMLHDREVNRDSMLGEPAKDRNTKEVEAESIAYTVLQHFGVDTSDYSFGYIAGWSSGKDMKELKSSLDTIRKTASELITSIEAQLQELRLNREMEQGQDIALLVRNTDLSEYDLLNVRGMDAGQMLNSLRTMDDADRQNVGAYLESKGAWVTLLADEKTEEVREYRLDYSYNTDTREITDIQHAMEMEKKAREPVGADDVVVKITFAEGKGFEIDRITNKTPEEVLEMIQEMALLYGSGRDGNIQNYLEERGVEYIPIIASDGTDSLMPQFYDFELNLDSGEVIKASGLSPMKQAEGIINRLEHGKTVFRDDERDLIVNYAYKLADMEKTRRLAEHIYNQRADGNQDAAHAAMEAQGEIDALPDPMAAVSEMHEYGYERNGMLPLTKETALELFGRDMPVYLLYKDGTEAIADERKQIMAHEGIFGIGKGDWENGKSLHPMQELPDGEANRETQLLSGGSDQYGIYQLKHAPEIDPFRFEGTASLMRRGITKDNFDAIRPENYELVYAGELSELRGQTQGQTLEAIFMKFNIDHPADYRGHSLSVSDIVVLHENGKNSAHFVDSFGFTGLPDFMRGLEDEKGQEQELDASGHDVQKPEAKQAQVEQPEPKQSEQEQTVKKLEITDMDDEDEIIDLGDEREQILAGMKKSLEGEQEISGQEFAFAIADRYISIQEVDGGYDYSIMDADYKEIDGGVYDNPDVTIQEALRDIVNDLKSAPDYNGAKGNIRMEDELIPIDYDELMEKVEEANRIVPENAQSSIIADFRAKTDELFHDISEMNPAEIEETIKTHVQAKIDEYGMDAAIVDAVVAGSRCRGLEREGSDLDVVVELSTGEREDDLFHAFNEDGLHVGGIKVDINPIASQRTGTLESYLPQVEEYLEGVREAREQEQARQVQAQEEAEKKEVEVTLTVAECGEFHSYGEFYENIPTVEEAVAIWKQIPPERLHGIPSIGISVHRPGEESYMDDEIDLLSGNRIDLEMLKYVPGITSEPKAMEVIAELIAKLPETEIDGVMSEELEARVWEKRLPDLEPAERLAVEFDRFYFDYDAVLYHDSIQSMSENVSELHELIRQGDTGHLSAWLNEVIAEGAAPAEAEHAKKLLEKLAEYKPLAKVEELEEQNYNMIDGVLNNGSGKPQKEPIRGEAERPAVRTSLKARLEEKKAQIAGYGQNRDAQENEKKNQREM